MNNYQTHALREFRSAGWIDAEGKYCDEMQEAICKHVLALLDVFADEGHSGSSAPYTINLFKTLAYFKPIGPLTGEDSEWNDVSGHGGPEEGPYFQNNRASHVFKDSTGAYDINGIVFWEWSSSPDVDDNKPYKCYFTGRDSRVPVTFPYTIPETPIYKFMPTEQYPLENL